MPRINLRSILIFGSLSLSLVLSCYFFFTPEIKISSKDNPLIEESMSGVKVTRFDKNGQLSQIVTMDSWEHLKEQTVTSMKYPALKIYYSNGNVCEISADQGEGFQTNLKSSLEKLHLMDNVVIHQLGQSPNSWWELKTTNLLYFPSSETALTDDPVTVLGPATLIKSQGMRAYLESHRVEFINQVTSQYAKPS